MKIIDIIKTREKTLFSFELLPPLRGSNADKLYNTIESLSEFKPSYINITAHRDDFEYVEREKGVVERRVVRKRPGTAAIAASIQHKYGITVVPHVVCGGFSKRDTELMLIDLGFLGIKNVLALRGDGLKNEAVFKAEPRGNKNANELVEQIVNLRSGKYLDDDKSSNTPLDFCIGVAGYPEKHFEAPNLEVDINYLKQKVDAGADYIVTQMFFDNKVYFDFVDKCRAKGITVPIIPGIKPLALKNQITVLPKLFNIDIPEALSKELDKCKDNEQAMAIGTEWAIAQTKELIVANVPSLHIYTYGLSDNTKEIVKAVF
ncbi:MAG: methylenetetrahydrofolate reductase [NAD(P)H] [Bacteroidales bacterium]